MTAVEDWKTESTSAEQQQRWKDAIERGDGIAMRLGSHLTSDLSIELSREDRNLKTGLTPFTRKNGGARLASDLYPGCRAVRMSRK